MTLPHEAFLQYMGAQLKPNIYIELGVDEGNTFNMIAPFVHRAIAVDIKIPENVEDYECYEMTTDDFFSDGWFIDKADLIFIDADHSYNGAKKDLKNALEILGDDGVIIMHDTDPISDLMCKENDKLDWKNLCGDVYRIVDDIEDGLVDHINIVTLPIGDAGLSLITKKKTSRTQQREASPDHVDITGKLKPKFYAPAAHDLRAELEGRSPYKRY